MRRGISFGGLATIVLTIVVFLPTSLWLYGVPAPIFAKSMPLPPPIATLRPLSDLATTKAHISFPLEGSNNHWAAKYLVHAEILYGVDLSQVAYAKVDPDKKEAVLSLPTPHLISSKIDHDQSEELYVKAVAWFPVSDKQLLREQAWKEAQRKLERLAKDESYGEHARTQAERVLANLFSSSGWKLSCRWPDSPPEVAANP